MKRFSNAWLYMMMAGLSVSIFPSLALAQGGSAPTVATPQSDVKTPPEKVTSTKIPSEKAKSAKPVEASVEKFEKAERLESMRYRHLWVAYGAIWLIIFLFVFRTWKMNQATSAELERLKARLNDLETSNGGS